MTAMDSFTIEPRGPFSLAEAANFGFGLHTLSTHEHNGHTPAESDGYTQAFFFPGEYYDYRWPFTLAVVSDVACLLVLLLGSATIGLV